MNAYRWLAIFGAVAFYAAPASAQYAHTNVPPYWIAPATGWPAANNPDMSGPGMYFVTPGGLVTGPHYYVNPPWCPETGYRPCGRGPGKAPPVSGVAPPPPAMAGGLPTVSSFPSHPYVRSPRDFFMFHENLEVERSRELRPIIVP